MIEPEKLVKGHQKGSFVLAVLRNDFKFFDEVFEDCYDRYGVLEGDRIGKVVDRISGVTDVQLLERDGLTFGVNVCLTLLALK